MPRMNRFALGAALVLFAGVVSSARAQSIDFTVFHTPAQIDAEMDKLKTSFPNLVKIDTIGTSVEGRPIRAIHISSSVLPDAGKGDAVLVGLHHAREWLSVETAFAIAERICQRYNGTPEIKADVDRLNIWVVPVVNPDGYAFTTTGANRFWRKNRRLNDNGSHGIDLNRNYYFFWGRPDGSSSDPWNDTYSGPWPFSEPEVQTLAAFLVSRQNLKFFITYHTFSELFLRPWSYTHDDPPGEASLHSVVERNIGLIRAVHDQTYGQDLYLMSGEATDFVWEWLRASPHTVELRPAATDTTVSDGFAPPASVIIPSNEENIPAAFAMLHDAAAREVWMRDYVGDTGDEPSAVLSGSFWSHPVWESPDITSGVANIMAGTTVTITVHVNNNTGAAVNNVTVEAYSDDPSALEVPTLTSTLIGSHTVNVPAGGADVDFQWAVPSTGNHFGFFYWNVGAVVKEKHDMPLTTKVERSSNVAMRTFSAFQPIPRRSDLVAVSNISQYAAELQLAVDSSLLAKGWRVKVIEVPREYPPFKAPIPRSSGSREGMKRKAKLLDAKGILLAPGETASFTVEVEAPADAKKGTAQDIRIESTLRPLVAGKRPVTAGGFTLHYVVP